MRRRARHARRAIELCGLVTLSACVGGYDRATDGPLEVRDAWVRATNVTTSAAMYGAFENHDDTTVRILRVGTSTARVAELHQSMQMNGMSHMQQVDTLTVAPRSTLTFKPGGVHVMLSDMVRPLTAGDTVSLTFQLAGGAVTIVTAVVREL